MAALDLVYSGGGSHVCQELGAHSIFENMPSNTIECVVGTSAGSMIAGAWGVGLNTNAILSILKEAFESNILDPTPLALPTFGVNAGEKIHALLKRHLPGTMGDLKRDARIVVCNLWGRKPEVITRISHPDVLVADAVRCSIAIPGVFSAWRLHPNRPQLYVDGGVAKNFALNAADDLPGRTIGIRLGAAEVPGQIVEVPVRPLDLAAYLQAMTALITYSAHAGYASEKDDRVLSIAATGDSMDFSLNRKEVMRRFEEGRFAAYEFVKAEELF